MGKRLIETFVSSSYVKGSCNSDNNGSTLFTAVPSELDHLFDDRRPIITQLTSFPRSSVKTPGSDSIVHQSSVDMVGGNEVQTKRIRKVRDVRGGRSERCCHRLLFLSTLVLISCGSKRRNCVIGGQASLLNIFSFRCN
jgi:hypothetical protein